MSSVWRKISIICGVIGLCCFIAAGSFALYNLYDDIRAGKSVQEETKKLEAIVLSPERTQERTAEQIWIMPTAEPKPTPAPEKQEPEKQEPDEPTSEPNEPTPEPTPVPDMPLVNIDGWDFVAIISIPALDKEYSVRNEWSRKGAKYSPCRYVGSVYTNDLVICAHNQMSLFGRLNELREGDQVILVDMDGRVYTYHVVLTEEIGPFDVEDMISSGYDLSLFTCTIRGRGRTTVRCTRDA